MKRETTSITSLESPVQGEQDGRELTLAFQRGDADAYPAVYERYSPRVQGICRRMLPDQTEAEEAAQETFMRVYRALGRFNGRYQLGAWITRIATNVCLDHLRARARHPQPISLDEGHAEDVSGDGTDPESLVMRRSEQDRVHECLAALPPVHRAALTLRDIEGLSYADIATALQMTESQVKALLHRARRGFRRSWPALGAFFPIRWLRKIRLDVPLSDTGAHALSVSQQVSSCSVLIQQCGTFMTERVAVVVVAAVVGTAAVGGQAPASPERPTAGVNRAQAVRAQEEVERDRKPGREHKRPATKAPEETAVPVVDPTTEPEPEPVPSTEPKEPPSEGEGEGEPPTQEPVPLFQPSLFFGSADPGGAPVSYHETAADCGARTFRQRIDGTISFDGRRYPALLNVQVGADTGRLELTVKAEGRNFHYLSWGDQPVATWSGDDSHMRLDFTGDYGLAYGQPTEDSFFPVSGRFAGVVNLDCTVSTVVTESFGFTAN
jgi:RNA polymerase sigma-70 factor, ECF subfamily